MTLSQHLNACGTEAKGQGEKRLRDACRVDDWPLICRFGQSLRIPNHVPQLSSGCGIRNPVPLVPPKTEKRKRDELLVGQCGKVYRILDAASMLFQQPHESWIMDVS